MKRKTIGTFSAGALALAVAGPLAAQNGYQEQPPAMVEPGAQVESPQPARDYLASNLMGMNVENRQGESVGEITDLVIQPDGSVSHVVVESGGFVGIGGEQYTVPYESLQVSKEQQVAILGVEEPAEFSVFEEAPFEAQEPGAVEESPFREEGEVVPQFGEDPSAEPVPELGEPGG